MLMWVHECLFVEWSLSQKSVQHKEKPPPSEMWTGKGTLREVQMSLCREKNMKQKSDEIFKFLHQEGFWWPGELLFLDLTLSSCLCRPRT